VSRDRKSWLRRRREVAVAACAAPTSGARVFTEVCGASASRISSGNHRRQTIAMSTLPVGKAADTRAAIGFHALCDKGWISLAKF